jgi:hypothetical protein
MLPIQDLVCLPPCNLDLARVRHNHIVTAVNYHLQSDFQPKEKKRGGYTTWIVDRFVLAHEHDCYPLRQFSKDTIFRVCMVPYPCIGEGGLIKWFFLVD